MAKDNRATKFEKEKRILAVQSWIIDGVQDDYMVRQMQTQWGVGVRQAKRYLEDAYKRWRHNENVSIEDRRAAKIADLKQVRRSLKTEFVGTPQGINAIVRLERLMMRLEPIEVPRNIKVDIDKGLEIKGITFKD